GITHEALLSKNKIPLAKTSPTIFPKGPININAIGAITIKVNSGTNINLIVFGTTLSKNLCTYDIAQTIKIIGTTLDPYLANVKGNPKNSIGSPALTKAEKFGCNKIPPN
ncbi:hypothetical protein SB767_29205, partial [Bacillus sp. SIMBA_069]